MATFYPFPLLPAEIRVQIWEMTVEPRIVDVRIGFKYTTTVPRKLYGPFLFSSTPVPAPLQTCREARNGALYQRAFSDLAVQNGAPKDSEQRYVWLNFDLDMVSVGDTDFKFLQPVAKMIKRLRFERDNSNDLWFFGDSYKLSAFVNATEIHAVVCADGDMRHWHGASMNYDWPCGVENVSIVDPKAGQVMKLFDLEEKYDRVQEAELRNLNSGDEMRYTCGYSPSPLP